MLLENPARLQEVPERLIGLVVDVKAAVVLVGSVGDLCNEGWEGDLTQISTNFLPQAISSSAALPRTYSMWLSRTARCDTGGAGASMTEEGVCTERGWWCGRKRMKKIVTAGGRFLYSTGT